MAATLYIIPTPIGSSNTPWLLETQRDQILHLRYFAVEVPKTARQHLRALNWPVPLSSLTLLTVNKNSTAVTLAPLLDLLASGEDIGLLCEAGCPAIADPGALLIAQAHDQGQRILPLIGPSAILMALMASGMPAQRFTFHGYLPKFATQRIIALRALEKESLERDATQIFIETPYRNDALLNSCINTLRPTTRLAIACELTLPNQTIISCLVKNWPPLPALHKKPCVFMLYAA
ncbi:MAG: SAM-dependent methyltransferase [Neisseriales bacterium]|nr:MAG: SAM-dependent methyltransferase [Neisseriales bacterium]